MSSSRREFLKRGSLMALVAGVPLAFTEKPWVWALKRQRRLVWI